MLKHRLKIMFGLTMLAFVMACSGGGSAGTSGSTGTGGGGGAGGAAAKLTFTTPDYTLAPGEEKRYLCDSVHTPADAETVVTKIAPAYGAGTHHLVVWQALLPSPEGVFDCPKLAEDTWFPVYVGGVGSNALSAPAGSGFHFPADSQLVLQSHLLDATADPITSHASLTLTTSGDKSLVPAGAYGFDNRTIALPAHSKDQSVTMTCAFPKKTHVFAVFGHMHSRGKHFKVVKGSSIDSASVIYDGDYNYDDQKIAPVDFDLAPGDAATTSCTYDNPSDGSVNYGQSVTDEMCSVVIYVTPWYGYGGCVNGASL
jgi:hypothetical protein